MIALIAILLFILLILIVAIIQSMQSGSIIKAKKEYLQGELKKMTFDQAMEIEDKRLVNLNKGSVLKAQNLILPDEWVYYAGIHHMNMSISSYQYFYEKNQYVFVITNKRVFCCRQTIGSATEKQIELRNIQSVRTDSKLSKAIITISGNTEGFTVNVSSELADLIVQVIHKIQHNLSKETRNSSSIADRKIISNQSNKLDDLAKLKLLLDDGALTQAEFDAEKKKLLNK
ncbi:MAG: PH domain-containing protein [Hominilimicola sp.]